MTMRLREVSLELEEDETLLAGRVADILQIDPGDVASLKVVRRSFDARKKPRVLRIYTVEFEVPDEEALLGRWRSNARLEKVASPSPPDLQPCSKPHRALVVGMGPAGLFAALRLVRQGIEVTLLEQGDPVEERIRKVDRFWQDGRLDPSSNVQFGEGGAGTFSDGKLTTRLNHPWTSYVLQTLVEFGAPAEILKDAKPHVGTDRLRQVLLNFRKALQAAGVTIRFGCRLTGLTLRNGKVCSGIVEEAGEVPCDSLLLAPGHSARDTYRMLSDAGVALQVKPFAVGFRVEHPAELINAIQFGHRNHPLLPAAEYALTYNDRQTGRGVYSFCMCPGGEVVNAASEAGGLVVNGMSNLRRAGAWSNSALVVSVRATDLEGSDPLAGVRFQQHWERQAFRLGGGSFSVPAQNLLDFLGRGTGPLRSTCRPGVVESDLSQALPTFVGDSLRQALPVFDRKMKGFVSSEATLMGVETRTSAPLRILRDEGGQSLSHPGLYPAGEGAGYAGGIMSAALDGLRAAGNIVEQCR